MCKGYLARARLTIGHEEIFFDNTWQKAMAATIQQMHCAQIPDVPILAACGSYLVHAVQIVKVLLNKNSRKAASVPMHAFFESKRMENGGDLKAALMKGPLTATIYTHSLCLHGGGHASYFLTLEGARMIIDELPNQDESVKHKFRGLFEEFLGDQSKAAEACRAGPAFSPMSAKPPTKRVKVSGPECGIYVLKFNDAGQPSFYVGKSNDIAQRLEQHAKGSGAACVSGRSFTRVPVVSKGSVDDLEAWERAEVLELMFQYGINAVRGWKYTLCTMPLEQKLSAFDDVCERFDLCRKCGRGSHFVNECHTVTTDRWTNGLELRSYYHQPAEGRLAAEHEGRLAAERRNAEAVRVLTGR